MTGFYRRAAMRITLIAVVSISVLGAAAVFLQRDSSGARPNVVLVTIDTLRADHLEIYGYPRDTAPFLSQLAESSTVFETAVSASSHTAPSHASIFTSLYPPQHGVFTNGYPLVRPTPTLAKVLRKNGYETAAFLSVSFLTGLSRGFDTFVAKKGNPERSLSARRINERALQWLAERDDSVPYFLWVHYFDVHEYDPRNTPVDAERVSRVRGTTRMPDAAFRERLARVHGIPATDPDRGDKAAERVDWYDSQIGRVDEALAELHAAVAPGALWVVTSDHGEGLKSHGYVGHGKYLYEEQLRVLLLLHGPGVPAGRVSGLARHIDISPTLYDLLDIPTPKLIIPWEGRSLVPNLRGRAADADRVAFAQRRPVDAERMRWGWAEEVIYSLRDERYKYIEHSKQADEIYDLQKDPLELRNLLADPPPQAAALGAKLRALSRKMSQQTANMATAEVDVDFLDELRALGYVE